MAAPNKYKDLLERLWELRQIELRGYKLYEDQQRLLVEFPRVWKDVGKALGHIQVEPAHHMKPIKRISAKASTDADTDAA